LRRTFWLLLVGQILILEMNKATVYLDNYTLKINLPFNSKFIKEFRKDVFNTFIWNKDEKYYETSFSAYSLRVCVNILHKYFEVTYSPELEQAISLLNVAGLQYFDVRLYHNGHDYYINNINEHLYDAIKDIKFSVDNDAIKDIKFSVGNLHLCKEYGIKIE